MNFRLLCFFCFALILIQHPLLFSSDAEFEFVKKIQAHLVLKNLSEASAEAHKALSTHPTSLKLQEILIKVLAHLGAEEEMFTVWKNYVLNNPEAYSKHDVIEEMAWGIVEKGHHSSSPIIRGISILAAFYNNDIRGVNIIHESLEDNNSFIRSIAAQFVGSLHDEKLKEMVCERFRKEKRWNVHLEIVKAIGKMKIASSYASLKKIIANDASSAEEKVAAIEAIVSMTETATREEVEALANSPRAGLRLLACAVVAQFDLKRDIDLIIKLLGDRTSDVRKGALNVIGLLRVKDFENQPINEKIIPLLKDLEPEVSIIASWVLTILGDPWGQNTMARWLYHERKEYRLMASGALASTGKYGFPLMMNAFKDSKDLYVRVNLAIGLIGQRKMCDDACNVLYQAFLNEKGKWMWEKKNLFRYLAPSTVKHKDEIPQYPEVVNQITRLEVIQMLTFLHFPKVEDAIKQFFREKPFGITGMASALLLTEGEEGAPDAVRGLLKDSDPKIRVQAALILALWGKEESVIHVLQEQYHLCEREIQERILEALGKVGSHYSIPFLVDRLGEQSQQVRLIAASSLLQCLYN